MQRRRASISISQVNVPVEEKSQPGDADVCEGQIHKLQLDDDRWAEEEERWSSAAYQDAAYQDAASAHYALGYTLETMILYLLSIYYTDLVTTAWLVKADPL